MSYLKEEFYKVYKAVKENGHSHEIALEAGKLHVEYLNTKLKAS